MSRRCDKFCMQMTAAWRKKTAVPFLLLLFFLSFPCSFLALTVRFLFSNPNDGEYDDFLSFCVEWEYLWVEGSKDAISTHPSIFYNSPFSFSLLLYSFDLNIKTKRWWSWEQRINNNKRRKWLLILPDERRNLYTTTSLECDWYSNQLRQFHRHDSKWLPLSLVLLFDSFNIHKKKGGRRRRRRITLGWCGNVIPIRLLDVWQRRGWWTHKKREKRNIYMYVYITRIEKEKREKKYWLVVKASASTSEVKGLVCYRRLIIQVERLLFNCCYDIMYRPCWWRCVYPAWIALSTRHRRI